MCGPEGLDELDGAIAGAVIVPGSAEYEQLRKPALARFWDLRPRAIVRCATADDVAAALAIARRARAAVAVRGGGHCFAGRSSTAGILVDLGAMSAITVAGETVTAGPGALLGDLYDALDAHGRTIAAGCGPSVGIAGLTLGGGIGILGRRHGLTSDQLLAAEVVLADGRVVRCDRDRHADLFWALRGAGGCRIGIVTSLVLATVPAGDTTCFDLRWPQPAIATVIDAWQAWAPDAPDEVAAGLLVTAGAEPDRPVAVRLFGAAAGPEQEARRALDGFAARAGVRPGEATLVQLPHREAKRWLAERDEGAGLKPEPGHLYAKSEFFRGSLPREAIAALAAHITAERVAGQARELDFTPLGGAYDAVPADATAFVHRGARFLLKHEVVVAPDASPDSRGWLGRSWAVAHPSGTGGAYPNFPDADLDAWDRAYHGANLERLLGVKGRYDPTGVFGASRPAVPERS